MNAHILIGTPAISKEVTTDYLMAIFRLQKHFANRSDVTFDLHSNSMSQIEMARNVIASMVLANREITHLLFVDADMGFAPDLIEDMLSLNKPVVGTIYPAKRLDLRSAQQAPKRGTSEEIHHIINEYVAPTLLPDSQGRIVVHGGKFVRVRVTGTGIMLIQRSVLERMAQLPNVLVEPFKASRPEYPDLLLNCFAHIADERGVLNSEDVSFCKRWTEQCGGEIWASIAHEILHTGSFTFRGRFLAKMQANFGDPDNVVRPA